MITIEEVTAANIDVYEKLIIDKLDRHMDKIVAYGAKYGEIPCGVIFAKLSKTDATRDCEITSFFVLPFFRKNGVGEKLLNVLKNKLKVLDIKNVKVQAVTSKEKIALLEDFLSKRGFSKSKLLTEVHLFHPEKVWNESSFIRSIVKSQFDLPEKVEIIPQSQVSKELLEKVKNKDGIDYPDVLSPFANEFNLNEGYSQFAVFDNTEIIGWLTALEAPENAILYRSLFVREDWRKSALGYLLFNAGIKNHRENFMDKTGVYAVALNNDNAQKFFSHYFKKINGEPKYEFEINMIV